MGNGLFLKMRQIWMYYLKTFLLSFQKIIEIGLSETLFKQPTLVPRPRLQGSEHSGNQAMLLIHTHTHTHTSYFHLVQCEYTSSPFSLVFSRSWRMFCVSWDLAQDHCWCHWRGGDETLQSLYQHCVSGPPQMPTVDSLESGHNLCGPSPWPCPWDVCVCGVYVDRRHAICSIYSSSFRSYGSYGK